MKQFLSSLIKLSTIKYITLNNMMTFFEAERKTKYQCIDNITLKKNQLNITSHYSLKDQLSS